MTLVMICHYKIFGFVYPSIAPKARNSHLLSSWYSVDVQ
jgi:hypothetical protein